MKEIERYREKEREKNEERRLQALRESARRWEQSAQHLERVTSPPRPPPHISHHARTHTNVCMRKSMLFRERRHQEWGGVRGTEGTEWTDGNPERGGNERIRGIHALAENNEKKRERERERERVHVCVTRSYISTVPSHCPDSKRTRNRAPSRTKRAAHTDLYARGCTRDSAMARASLGYLPLFIRPDESRRVSLLFATGVLQVLCGANSEMDRARF